MNKIILKNSIFPEETELFCWDENALEAFKNLINEEGIKCRMDDIFLLGFLRAKSFDVEKSFHMLKSYYDIRVQYLQYFKDLIPSKVEHALSLNCVQFLPKPDQKGRYIFINQVAFLTTMEIKSSIFAEDKEEFPWDENALKTFKKIIKDQGIKCCMDDIFLLGFLRARKYEMGRSLQLLKNYYEIRLQYPQYFKDHLPSKVEHVLSLNTMQFLPKPDQKGRYVFIFQYANWDTSIANSYDVFRCCMLFFDFQLNFHRTQENRIVAIANGEGISLSHFLQATPSFLNSMTKVMLKDAYQARLIEIHFVNLNIIIKAFLSIFIPLLPSKLRDRLHLHSDMSTLHEFVSPDCLPLEYGGNLPSFDPTEANNMLKANEDFFRKKEEYLELYEEQKNKNFSEGKFRYVNEDFEDEKVKKIIEKTEERFKTYSHDPEAFLAAMKQDSELEITHF
ncbi:alpha-tocopherol transfer protein-like isoform X2 [Centruroides vittatus]|uniref:alpha-tocopherol transfer protein-like isoform X2 n=1 Tax=Centruroides vittatus TaxID=120091 RepID=UPI0035103BD3